MYRLLCNRNSISHFWFQTNVGGVIALFQYDILLIILTLTLPRHQWQDVYACSAYTVNIFRTDRDSFIEIRIPVIWLLTRQTKIKCIDWTVLKCTGWRHTGLALSLDYTTPWQFWGEIPAPQKNCFVIIFSKLKDFIQSVEIRLMWLMK